MSEPWPTNEVLIARAMAHARREGVLRRFALEAMRTAFLRGGDLIARLVVKPHLWFAFSTSLRRALCGTSG